MPQPEHPLRPRPAAELDTGLGVLRWWLGWPLGLWRALVRVALGSWHAVFMGAQLVVLALSPSSYRQGSGAIVLRHLYQAAGPGLPGFTALMGLFNVVVIRIVVVTAFAYGLSSFALDAVVRVLVLEVIPLVAALYVAVEYSIPQGSELFKLRRSGAFERLQAAGRDPLGCEVLPRALAGMFAVLLMAAVSCALSLVLAYIAVHGFNLAGVPSYNHAVGHIFNPVVSLIFALKTLLFALAVGLLPVASALRERPRRASRTSVELQGLVQLFVIMLGIEIVSLVGNYY